MAHIQTIIENSFQPGQKFAGSVTELSSDPRYKIPGSLLMVGAEHIATALILQWCTFHGVPAKSFTITYEDGKTRTITRGDE